MLLYYSAVKIPGEEIRVWREESQYFPVHLLAKNLGASDCRLQPLLHAFSGKDDVSSLYGVGKATFHKARKRVDCSALHFRDKISEFVVTENMFNTALQLLKTVYKVDGLDSLASARAHLYLKSYSKELKRLPPALNTFNEHLLRSVHATIVQIPAHIAKPKLPSKVEFRCVKVYDTLKPVAITQPPFPEITRDLTSCKCCTCK